MTLFNVCYTGRASQNKLSCIDGAKVTYEVDAGGNRPVGVAVLECEEGWETHVSEALNDLEEVQSFFIRQ